MHHILRDNNNNRSIVKRGGSNANNTTMDEASSIIVVSVQRCKNVIFLLQVKVLLPITSAEGKERCYKAHPEASMEV